MNSNTDTKTAPWFWFLILKQGFGSTLYPIWPQSFLKNMSLYSIRRTTFFHFTNTRTMKKNLGKNDFKNLSYNFFKTLQTVIDGFDPDKFRKVNKDSKNSSNYDTGIHVERQFNSSASSNGSSSTRYVYGVEQNPTHFYGLDPNLDLIFGFNRVRLSG